jgi:chemotaxis protein MotB
MPQSPPPSQSQRMTESLHPTPAQHWRAPVDDDVGSWPITFSDLVLLLLCFFVLYHVAEKQHSARVSQVEPPPAVQQTSPTFSPSQTTALTSVELLATAQPQQQQVESLSEQHSQISPTEQSVKPTAVTRSDWQQALQAQLDRYVHMHGLDRNVGVISTEQGLIISLSDTVTFPSGRVTLSATVASLLDQVAALAMERPDLDIEITGHTDDRQIATTEFPSNWELSAARASRVARALLERERVDPTRVSTRGYASYRPVSPNDTEEHRAANRRVEIRFFQRVEAAY